MKRNTKIEITALCIIFAVTFLVNLLYLIGAYPGNMTIDSVNQFNQIATNSYNNYHPVFSSLIYKLPTLIYFSLASIICAQVLFFSAVTTYFAFCTFRYTKIKTWIIVAVTLAFSMFPTNGFMLTNMWKDIPYSICIMLLTCFLFNFVASEGEWFNKKRNIAVTIISMACVALIRHNGVVIIGITGLTLAFYKKTEFRKFLIITIVAIICFFGTEKIISKALNASDTLSKADIVSIPLQQIAAVIQSNGNLTKKQESILYKIASKEEWSYSYNRYLSDNIKNLANKKFAEDSKLRTEIIKMYPSICMHNFKTVTKAYLHQTSIIWRFNNYERGALTYYTLEENNYGFSKHELVPAITKTYKRFLEVSRDNFVLRFVIWNPAIIMYVVIILMIITIIKTKKAGIIVIAMPMLANIASLLISIPAQDYRYLYANILCGFVILLYFISEVCYNNKHKIQNKEAK